MKTFKKWLGVKKKGQGMTEYIIIVALIAVAAITVVTAFGNQIRELFFTSGKKLSGDDSYKQKDRISEAEGAVDTGLDDL